MSAGTDFVSLISGTTAITDLIANRFYSDAVPQDLPGSSLAYSVDDTEYINTIHGGPTDHGHSAAIKIAAMANKRVDAEILGDLLITTLRANRQFFPTNRQYSYDEESGIYASIITAQYIS